jgi:hypothetical protein
MTILAGARKPVLLVEGDGDTHAVPFLIRKVAQSSGLHDLVPCSNPIKCGEIPKLRKQGQLERFVQYACQRNDGDSVVLVVDCDDDCPVLTSVEFTARVREIAERYSKKVGIAFIHKEFETVFLFSLLELSLKYPEHGWRLNNDDNTRDWSTVRGAKGELNRRMKNYAYKETRDQVKFVSAIDVDNLTSTCRSALHLQRLIYWLYSDSTNFLVYPTLTHG